ncbi:hypothetical protein B4V02_16585 [Paenibacillus kribbensis]|uniref:Uncharacterized protein n=1 Tax=Paenibacillus kribbensis TaxID=172713 RepID=A0A222WP05_9BACL|nr:hypothetical protein B4V02_16585 [Paenibacillus kribbensis]
MSLGEKFEKPGLFQDSDFSFSQKNVVYKGQTNPCFYITSRPSRVGEHFWPGLRHGIGAVHSDEGELRENDPHQILK